MEDNSSQPLAVGELPAEIKEQLKFRENLCKSLDGIPAMPPAAFRAEIERLRDEYAASPVPPPEYAEVTDKKFAEALENAGRRAQALEAREAAFKKLESELEQVLAAEDLLVKSDLEKFDAACLKLLGSIPEEFAARTAPFRERIAAEEALAAADTEKAVKLMDELKNLTDAEDVAPLRERKSAIDAEFRELTHLPPGIRKHFQEASHKASLKISQFFEELDLARWESYTLKQDICAKIEEMNKTPDPDFIKFSKELQELRERWKSLGPVPKEKNEEINAKFLESSRPLQRRIDEFFSNRRQERKQAAAEKEALAAEAEKLRTSTEWNATAAAFKELQAKWKALPRAGAEERELFAKFRSAADTFFNARSAYFAERDRKFAAIAERKEALIAEAEALTPKDLHRVRRLREEFRAAGNAGKAESGLYERLKAALDKFFDERRAAFAEKENESSALIAELRRLTADPNADPGRAREIRSRLQELDCRETAAAAQKAMEEFDEALAEKRKKETRAKGDMGREVAREVARALENVLAGKNFEFTPPPAAEMFPKLSSAAKLISAALSGDEKALDKLNRQVAAARQEHERICSELEKLAGAPPETDDNLAAALQAAIAGNFAKAQAREAAKGIDPNKLASEYLNAGPLPPAELESSFDRFDAAMGKL